MTLDKAQEHAETLTTRVTKLKHSLDSTRKERDQITEHRDALQSEMAVLRRAHEQTREELAGTQANSEALKERANNAEKERDRLLADQALRWGLILE